MPVLDDVIKAMESFDPDALLKAIKQGASTKTVVVERSEVKHKAYTDPDRKEDIYTTDSGGTQMYERTEIIVGKFHDAWIEVVAAHPEKVTVSGYENLATELDNNGAALGNVLYDDRGQFKKEYGQQMSFVNQETINKLHRAHQGLSTPKGIETFIRVATQVMQESQKNQVNATKLLDTRNELVARITSSQSTPEAESARKGLFSAAKDVITKGAHEKKEAYLAAAKDYLNDPEDEGKYEVYQKAHQNLSIALESPLARTTQRELFSDIDMHVQEIHSQKTTQPEIFKKYAATVSAQQEVHQKPQTPR